MNRLQPRIPTALALGVCQVIAYGMVAVLFLGYLYVEEVKNFGGDAKLFLMLGLVTSLFWPIILIVVCGHFLEDFFWRCTKRRSRHH